MFRSLVFLLALPLAHAYVTIGITCEQFVVDGGAVEEVCAWHQMMGPSPAMINDTLVYIGDYVDTYNILELDDRITAEETEAMPSNYTDYLSGLIVEVTRFSEGGCDVSINRTACANCEICGDENSTLGSVDCSAIPGGRAVECEPLDNVYFPFAGYVLANTTDGLANRTTGDGEVSTNPPSTTGDGEVSTNPPSTTGDGEVSTNPPSEGPPEVSASHRSMAVFITVVVGAVGTILQL